ncbi:hypothetical protein GCM10018963_65020 [Saccharothrix longispora]
MEGSSGAVKGLAIDQAMAWAKNDSSMTMEYSVCSTWRASWCSDWDWAWAAVVNLGMTPSNFPT